MDGVSALSSITSLSSSHASPQPPHPSMLLACSPLLIRFSASVAGVKHNYHPDHGRQWGKDRAVREKKERSVAS